MDKSHFEKLNIRFGQNVIIHRDVEIGRNVVIGDNCIIYPNSRIGDNSFIGPFCTIGEPSYEYYDAPNKYLFPVTKIGAKSIIRSYSLIYSDVQIGDNFQSGHRITIREKTIIGNNSKIGTLSDIQGKCFIGNHVNIHSNVHVCQGSTLKNYVRLYPYVVLTNDKTPPSDSLDGPTIEDFAVIATASVILPRVTVGKDALVGANSLVKKDVAPEMLVAGNPAKDFFSVRKIKDKNLKQVYPWRYSFDRGMPWEGIDFDQWEKDKKNGQNNFL